MTHVCGPDFLALQVRDLQRSAGFYERELGLQRTAESPPGVVAFQTSPIPFAVREPLPGTDLVAASLNNRPRKTIGFMKPSEKLGEFPAHTA